MKSGKSIRQLPAELDIKQALNVVNDPISRHSLLTLYLQTQIASILQLNESQIDIQQSISILGLDSLGAAELTYKIEKSIGVILELADLLQATSILHLASQLLTQFDTPAAASPVLPKSTKQDNIDKDHLSYGQRGMWFLQRLAPENTAYNIASAVRSYGKLSIPALRQAFQKLDALPRTPTGKVNRSALPSPSDDRPEIATVYAAPKGDLGQILVQTWQQVLKGIHDKFFDLGSHSFLMAQVHYKLQESYCELSMAELFQYTTIHSLANYLKQSDPNKCP